MSCQHVDFIQSIFELTLTMDMLNFKDNNFNRLTCTQIGEIQAMKTWLQLNKARVGTQVR
jgi:hypothetical protein